MTKLTFKLEDNHKTSHLGISVNVNKVWMCFNVYLVAWSLFLSLLSSPQADEIAFVEGMTIVYKCSIDLFFYVVGSAQENEVGNVMQREYKARLVLQRLYVMARILFLHKSSIDINA